MLSRVLIASLFLVTFLLLAELLDRFSGLDKVYFVSAMTLGLILFLFMCRGDER